MQPVNSFSMGNRCEIRCLPELEDAASLVGHEKRARHPDNSSLLKGSLTSKNKSFIHT